MKFICGSFNETDRRPTMLVEWTPACQAAARHAPEELFEELIGLGYSLTVMDEVFGQELTWQQALAQWRKGLLPDYSTQMLGRYQTPGQKMSNLALLVAGGSQFGDWEMVIPEIQDALPTENWRLHMVVPSADGLAEWLSANGVGNTVVSARRWTRTSWSLASRVRTVMSLVRSNVRIDLLVLRLGANLIISNMITMPGGFLAGARRRHCWYIHEFGDLDYGRCLRIGWSISDVVFPCSHAVLRDIIKYIDAALVRVLPYGVWLDESDGSSHDETGAVSEWIKVGQVGRTVASKGAHLALDAVLDLHSSGANVRLELVGAPHRDYVAQLRRRANVNAEDECLEY